MEIAVLLFPNLTVLDAAGPAEVLGRLPDVDVRFVARRPGIIESQSKSSGLSLVAEHGLHEVPTPDIVLVPGGPGYAEAAQDEATLEWLRQVHSSTEWTTSVCTGSLLLGAAGLLDGLRATTHWSAMAALAETGAVPTHERVVRDGKIVTGAGVSAGIDMALHLAALICGEDQAKAIQLQIEYDPSPPFDSGSLTKASAEVRCLLNLE